MLYNHQEFPKYVRTAGKITVVTAMAGLLVFIFAFVFDVGTKEFNRVLAQNQYSTTTLTVLNTPPVFTWNAYEVPDSSTSTPTNSGDNITWSGIAVDSNSAPWFLLICSDNATPTANKAASQSVLGSAPPTCNATTSAITWGVSASTTSGAAATVSTTTTEVAPFGEQNEWFAWACDDDPVSPRCTNVPVTGPTSTSASSSPFSVNKRPNFSDFNNNGPVDPAGELVFHSTSSDDDTSGGEDSIYLVVCNSVGWATSSDTCFNATDFIASTTFSSILSDAAATFTVPSPQMDDTYPAYGYIFDEHGHEATANPINFDFIVNNVAPVVPSGQISLNGGLDMTISQAGAETTGFTLDFRITDANSCNDFSSSSAEISGYYASVYRGTSTDPVSGCDYVGGDYDPNNCYENSVPTTTWNLSCSATTTCKNSEQNYMDYTCTFPLWFVADPTDPAVNIPDAFKNDDWFAAVAGTDDDYATGTPATTTNPVDVESFAAIDVLAAEIVYGAIEPGSNNPNLSATSTAQNVGNTGLDQEVDGEAMCNEFSPSAVCPNSASSTVPDWRQQLSTTTYAYDTDALFDGTNLDPRILQLSSSTPGQELELNVPKTTGTSTPEYQEGTTYWGIAVPASITLAGSYTGLNTFTARTAEAGDWTP